MQPYQLRLVNCYRFVRKCRDRQGVLISHVIGSSGHFFSGDQAVYALCYQGYARLFFLQGFSLMAFVKFQRLPQLL